MPSYDFKCIQSNCSQNESVVEVVKKISDPKPNCSECNSVMTQVFNYTPPIKLVGRGWTGSKATGRVSNN